MEFIKTINAIDFSHAMPNSSTQALLIICADGKEYVLKHAGCEEAGGTNILIAEYLSYLVAQRFNLPIPEYSFIKITKKFLNTVEDKDFHNMLKNGPELCIGSVYIHGSLPFSEAFKLKGNDYRLLFKTIFGFDQYIYNNDRFPENPNLLFIPQRLELVVIDHSLAIWPILNYEEALDAPIESCNGHVLYPYAKGDMLYVVRLIKEIYDVTIKYFIDTIPEEWLSEDLNKNFLTEFFKVRRDNIGTILKGVRKCKKSTTNTNLSLF